MASGNYNNCLVVAATAKEIAPFLEVYNRKSDEFAGTDILITGVGIMAATWSITRQIGIKRPDLVIQAGVAGSFESSIQLGTVFVVKEDTIADLGVMEKKSFKSIFDLKLSDPDQFPFSKGWLSNPHKLINKTGLKKIRGITVNEISTEKEKIDLYRKKFNALAESMEGAALHYICLLEKIPFVQLRAISNYAAERNKKKWLLKESIDNLNHQLTHLLNSI